MPTQPTPPPLTPRVQRLLALDGPTFGRPKPTPEEVQAIRGVLAEGPVAARRLNLARAMYITADNAPDAETARLIGRILNNPDASAALRHQAADVLGDIPLDVAGTALTTALASSTPGLEATLLKSLAKNGNAEAVRIIAARPPTASARLNRLRDFARAVILYRIGAPIDEKTERAIMPRRAEVTPPAGVDLPVAHEPPAAVEEAIKRFRGSTYGLRFDPALGHSFRCANVRHLVLLSATLRRGTLIASLAAARRIAGVVAIQDEKDASASYLTRRLIVTSPARDAIDVAVISPEGEVDLRGTLRPAAPGYVLTLRTYGARPLAAVDGVVREDGLVLNVRAVLSGASKAGGGVDPAAA